MTALTYEKLQQLVLSDGVALRVRQVLQPAGGQGDKVFPPTYATGDKKLKYAVEKRRIDGAEVECVLLDSVASQANRMEEALQAAWDEGTLTFPVITVDFSQEPQLADVGTISTLQTPHRIADAILRDAVTEDGSTLFRDTSAGRAYTDATTRNATAVFELCPTALVFGVWDSTGPKGGLGAKFQRALTSEIVAVNTLAGAKVGSRIDPLGIQANVEVYHRKDNEDDWTIDQAEAKVLSGKPVAFSRKGAEGKGKPSAVNHSNIAPSIDEFAGGITCDYAVQSTVLSLPALRRLRFAATQDGTPIVGRRAAEQAAHLTLAALGLAGIVAQRKRGYDLRSRCLLIPDGGLQLEAIHEDGAVEVFYLAPADAFAFVQTAAAAAVAAGLQWTREPLRLRPAPKLAALVRRSREVAAAGTEGDN